MPHYVEGSNSSRQRWLFERSLDEMLPQDSDVRALDAVMNHLDFGPLEASYCVAGRPAYSPRMMTKSLIYAYSKGIFSSRRIEELFRVDLRFLWLADGATPDHTSIARFRTSKGEYLKELFVQSVHLCQSLGLVTLDVVSVDGTRIPASAGTKSIYDESRVARQSEAVQQLLDKVAAIDAAEDASGGGLGKVPTVAEVLRRKRKLEAVARELKEQGQKRVIATDPESRVMKTRAGNRPAYNVQMGVDAANQVIVSYEVSQGCNDHGLLEGVVEEAKANTGSSVTTVVADAGYDDEATMEYLERSGQDGLIAVSREAHSCSKDKRFTKECFTYDEVKDCFVCPEGKPLEFKRIHYTRGVAYRCYAARGCAKCQFYSACVSDPPDNRRLRVGPSYLARRQMRRRLETEEGRQRYGLRAVTSEPVFGQIKHNRGWRSFLLRGIAKASVEVALVAAVHNLKKAVVAAALSVLRFIQPPRLDFTMTYLVARRTA